MRLAIAALALLVPATLLGKPAPLSCEGRKLDLAELLAAAHCLAWGDPEPVDVPAKALRATIAPKPKTVAPDAHAAFEVVLENRSREPLVLRFPVSDSDVRTLHVLHRREDAWAQRGHVPGFEVETLDAEGRSLVRPRSSPLDRMTPEAEKRYVEVTLLPKGKARARVLWRAWRDSPEKVVRSVTTGGAGRRAPLPPGRYTVRAKVPFVTVDGAPLVAERTVTVRAPKGKQR